MPGLIMDRRPRSSSDVIRLLEIDGVGYGKPGTPPEAVRRWQQIRGRAATLHTGHHVILRQRHDRSHAHRGRVDACALRRDHRCGDRSVRCHH